jgi:hypothetical protein
MTFLEKSRNWPFSTVSLGEVCVSCLGCVGDDQAPRSGQRLVLYCPPPALLEPSAHVLLAVDIPFTTAAYQKFSRRQGRGQRLRAGPICPQVDQEQARPLGDAFANAAKQFHVALWRVNMDDVSNDNRIAAIGNRILEEVPFYNPNALRTRAGSETLTCEGSHAR